MTKFICAPEYDTYALRNIVIPETYIYLYQRQSQVCWFVKYAFKTEVFKTEVQYLREVCTV